MLVWLEEVRASGATSVLEITSKGQSLPPCLRLVSSPSARAPGPDLPSTSSSLLLSPIAPLYSQQCSLDDAQLDARAWNPHQRHPRPTASKLGEPALDSSEPGRLDSYHTSLADGAKRMP